MIVIFFMSVILSCLSLYSAIPSCPNSCSCPSFSSFNPSYNATDDSCGLINVSCVLNGAAIHFEQHSYNISYKFYSISSFLIQNKTFEKFVNNESCDALMNSFTCPNPHRFSFSIPSFIRIFKCTKNSSYAPQDTDAYFDKHNYNSYKGCDNHNFYYKHYFQNTSVPSNLPDVCQGIQLPLEDKWERQAFCFNESNIFSLLSCGFNISFPQSSSCDKCHKNGSQCHTTDNVQVQCLEADNKKKKRDKELTLILVLVGFAGILLLCPGIFIIRRCFKGNPFSYVSSKHNSPILEDGSLFCDVSVFSYNELEDATQNFNPSRELGNGGFGAVYYGKLQDGREIAVKRLYEHNYKRVQHFKNEVDILTSLRHPNLVVLYGSTSRQDRELLLVYEYIPNGTVADHLHGTRANPSLLTWPIRMKIAIETASALVYLHASEIIHRDVKTNNMLVDHNFSVKVADFGLSRLVPNNVTHVSTTPQGTPGYVDPQYHQCYQLTDKSDVYSFGVVLIELISSMLAVDLSRCQDEISLANFALNRIQRCVIDQLIDPNLGSDSNEEIKNMITSVAELAFRCLQYDSELRPTMNEVLDALMDIQATGCRHAHDGFGNLSSVNPPPPSEANDTVVLMKDFLPLPVSVTREWQSDHSASTALSSNGDRL